MSQRKTSAAHALGAVLGGVGLSVLAGVLIAALVTPTLVVMGSTVKESVGIFDSLPTFIEIDQQAQRNRIFATQDGQPVEIATVFSQNREEVAWEEVSDFVKDAAVSGEDRRYFEHGGIDPTGIVRAAAKNLKSGSQRGRIHDHAAIRQKHVCSSSTRATDGGGTESGVRRCDE